MDCDAGLGNHSPSEPRDLLATLSADEDSATTIIIIIIAAIIRHNDGALSVLFDTGWAVEWKDAAMRCEVATLTAANSGNWQD